MTSRALRFSFVLAGVACGPVTVTTTAVPKNPGADPTGATSTTCTTEQDGDGRCKDTTKQLCEGGSWKDQTDCALFGQGCSATEAVATCVRVEATNNPDNPVTPGTCTRNGHTSAFQLGFYDNDVIQMAGAQSLNDAQAPTELLQLIVPPAGLGGPSAGSSVDLADGGLLLFAGDIVGQAVSRQFLATAGAAQVDVLPTEVGGELDVTVTNVQLAEVNQQGQPVANGELWCVDSIQFKGPTTRWPCFFLGWVYEGAPDMAPGQSLCMQGNQRIACNAAVPVPNDPGQLVLEDCAAAGDACNFDPLTTTATCGEGGGNGGGGNGGGGGTPGTPSNAPVGSCLSANGCLDYIGSLWATNGSTACTMGGGSYATTACNTTAANYLGGCLLYVGTATEVVSHVFGDAAGAAAQQETCVGNGGTWL